MGEVTGLEVAAMLWIVTAVAVTAFMARRGHRPAKWVVLAFALGPLVVPLAAWARYRAQRVAPVSLQLGVVGSDGLAVLVGVDGSREARMAALAAADLLGPQVAQITLAWVLDYETVSAAAESPERAFAVRVLGEIAAEAEEILRIRPATVLLAGAPAEALLDEARRSGADLIVVGTHGRGESDWLLGSVAAALARQREVRAMILAAPSPPTGDT